MLKGIVQITLCGLFVSTAAAAQPEVWEQTAKLVAADAAADDQFGRSVAVSGDTAIVGAHWDDDVGNRAGSVYVFERDAGGAGNWGQVAKLIALDGAADDRFGFSVSIDGDSAIVGAWWDDDAGNASGSAYVFERDEGGSGNWEQVAKLTAADGSANDWFGFSVSISGGTAVVGANFASGSGAAYVFQRNEGGVSNWGQVIKLTADDAAGGDQFGQSVGISNDTVAVGANADDDAGGNSGSTYVFDRNSGGVGNWGLVSKLTASDAAAGDEFGFSVAISGDIVIVGAHADDDDGSGSGSAYVFGRNFGGVDNWGQVEKLTAADAAAEDFFGFRVSLSNDVAIVGAQNDDDVGINSGSAYVFGRNFGGVDNWGQVEKIAASDASSGDAFGFSVSVSGDIAIATALRDDDAGNSSGSAYVFRSTGPVLSIPEAIPAISGASVSIPVDLTTNANLLASLAFSIDYDASCLSFDPTDTNPVDGIPDAININLSTDFSAVVFFDLGDTDAEIDIAIFANDPTSSVFTDGTLVTLKFISTCSSSPTDPILTPILFSSNPSPDFGDPNAEDVIGSSVNGSVEIFSGLRGDCNAGGDVRISDVTACLLETFDGDGFFWADTLDVVPYLGSPVGCDANADTAIDAGDISCIVRLRFGLACGGGASRAADEGPRLTMPGELRVVDGSVVVPINFEHRGIDFSSLIFSIDYDETQLAFDYLPGAVRFVGTQVVLQKLTFDARDRDGELDVVIADLSNDLVLAEGALLEVDLRLLEPNMVTIVGAVTFSTEPPASFGDVEGRSVHGVAEVLVDASIFSDGFETGDTSAWSGATP